ncbi:MAG: uracil-DNA glycosylase [Candidatus Omnitrophota bacterium]
MMHKEILEKIRSYFNMEKESGIKEYLFFKKEKKDSLSLFKKEILGCIKCDLSKTRKNVVFGDGFTKARLVFVGEAPGYEEDIQGKPFVGDAGKLLTKIIESMKLKREDVYICNVLKCRPPKNRNPLPEEIAHCMDYLYRQLELIKPEVICGLGKFASQTLLKTDIPITKLRGKWHDFKGMKFMPTYHPAYLLRNPKDKKLVWEDMKKIMEVMSL